MTKSDRLRVLVTGATGFLGGNILKALAVYPDIECIAACRTPSRLPSDFRGGVRAGDLLDARYRRDVVRDIDVVCHAGTWASMWGHKRIEQERFFEPAKDLIEQSITQGVQRFVLASTVAISEKTHNGKPHDDFSAKQHTGYWPHLDFLMDLDDFMQANCHRGTRMVNMRLGHFVGSGNRLGMLPALVPRLKTCLVPWLGDGTRRLPLVADTDLGHAFALAARVERLNDYESFNICGEAFPTLREVVTYIAQRSAGPRPLYRVPYPLGYAFGGLMELLKPVMPGTSPFLTRSIVHLCEDWFCPTTYAQKKLGYVPRKPWRVAIDEHLADLEREGYPWPALCQP